MRNFLPLLLFLCCLAIIGCDDEQAIPEPTVQEPGFCFDRQELTGCVELRNLTRVEHFAALVGTYRNIHSLGTTFNPYGSLPCGRIDARRTTIELRADSTYTLSWEDREPQFGNWQVVERINEEESAVESKFAFFGNHYWWPMPTHRCDGELYFEDTRPSGGSYSLYLKE